MAQLLLQQGRVTEALKYFEKASMLSRTEAEIVNALSYAEATRIQLKVIPASHHSVLACNSEH
jgi:mitochondrial import receptor subunit TOM70